MSQTKQCQRCQATFTCNTDDIANCGCNSIDLSQNTKEYLAKTKYDCLCNKCLETLNELVDFTHKYDFPKSSKEMARDVHFYVENGKYVFTEFYLMQRGYCCENGCRHCAYGYKSAT